jgi:hypothetical protein
MVNVATFSTFLPGTFFLLYSMNQERERRAKISFKSLAAKGEKIVMI